MKTERMTILVTAEQKAAIVAQARHLGLSTGEMVRRAVDSYQVAPDRSEDEAVLNALAGELMSAAKQARAALRGATREAEATLEQLARNREARRVLV